MAFCSVLFETVEHRDDEENLEPPACLADLNLDQLIDAVISGKEDYDLRCYYYHPLREEAAIRYRQQVAQDLEAGTLLEDIKAFSSQMSTVRRYLKLIEKLYFQYHKEGWFLEAVDVYCQAVTGLARFFSHADLKSRGLLALRAFLLDYVKSEAFILLSAEARSLKERLSVVHYCILVKESTVRVCKYEGESDYSAEVESAFEKFKQGAVKDYKVSLFEGSGMNHVEAQILDCIAKLYPDIFSGLSQFCSRHSGFFDETIRLFDREVQFYVAYLDYISALRQADLSFCYPQCLVKEKEIYSRDGFDLALAAKLFKEGAPVICNDFYLKGDERIFVVTGPNQGGKTTFARAFGQLHYLASLGLAVPGRQAGRTFPFRPDFYPF
jgi:hypothetical protein